MFYSKLNSRSDDGSGSDDSGNDSRLGKLVKVERRGSLGAQREKEAE